MPASPRSPRATKTKTVNGRVVSAKSKTNDAACSQAVSDWKRNGMTPIIAAILGKCRASAHARKKAEMHAAAGNEGKATLLRRKAENTAPTNAAQRLARAKELRGQRAEKGGSQTAAKPPIQRNATVSAYRAEKRNPRLNGSLAEQVANAKATRDQKRAGRQQEKAFHAAQDRRAQAGKPTGYGERLAKAKALREQRASDRQALQGYAAADYRTINSVLRGQGKAAHPDAIQSRIAAIDRATNKKLNKDTTLYRGIDASVLKGIDPEKLVGRVVPSQGFTSTSTSQDVAYRPDFNKGVIIKINAPKGTRGATIHGNTGEKEVILARNAQLKFTRVSKGGVDDSGKRVTVLHADVVGSGTHAPGRNTPMRLSKAKELRVQRAAKTTSPATAPSGPSLREQVAAHRASKGTAEERSRRLADLATSRGHSHSNKTYGAGGAKHEDAAMRNYDRLGKLMDYRRKNGLVKPGTPPPAEMVPAKAKPARPAATVTLQPVAKPPVPSKPKRLTPQEQLIQNIREDRRLKRDGTVDVQTRIADTRQAIKEGRLERARTARANLTGEARAKYADRIKQARAVDQRSASGQARISEQSTRADQRQRAKMALFGGQLPSERPLTAPTPAKPSGPTALQSLIRSKSAAVVRTGAERVQRRQATLKAAAEFRAKKGLNKSDREHWADVIKRRHKDLVKTQKLSDGLATYTRDPFKGVQKTNTLDSAIYDAKQRLLESVKHMKKDAKRSKGAIRASAR